jgi:hypothetical protein
MYPIKADHRFFDEGAVFVMNESGATVIVYRPGLQTPEVIPHGDPTMIRLVKGTHRKL